GERGRAHPNPLTPTPLPRFGGEGRTDRERRPMSQELPPPADAQPRTIEWVGGPGGFVRLLDQTLLPATVAYRDCRTAEEVWEAIRSLRVRGAPAIGIAAAMGVVVGVQGCADPAGYNERVRA